MQDKIDSPILDPPYPKPYGMLVSEQFFLVVPQKLSWGCTFEVFAPQNGLNWGKSGPETAVPRRRR